MIANIPADCSLPGECNLPQEMAWHLLRVMQPLPSDNTLFWLELAKVFIFDIVVSDFRATLPNESIVVMPIDVTGEE